MFVRCRKGVSSLLELPAPLNVRLSPRLTFPLKQVPLKRSSCTVAPAKVTHRENRVFFFFFKFTCSVFSFGDLLPSYHMPHIYQHSPTFHSKYPVLNLSGLYRTDTSKGCALLKTLAFNCQGMDQIREHPILFDYSRIFSPVIRYLHKAGRALAERLTNSKAFVLDYTAPARCYIIGTGVTVGQCDALSSFIPTFSEFPSLVCIQAVLRWCKLLRLMCSASLSDHSNEAQWVYASYAWRGHAGFPSYGP